mmetsp:Transcript_22640/g.50582  ORF Transcript_22640/g.50582 Transcript_22640/m.50582 type:complete len:89 (+) Transcript_22640:363-629(+)
MTAFDFLNGHSGCVFQMRWSRSNRIVRIRVLFCENYERSVSAPNGVLVPNLVTVPDLAHPVTITTDCMTNVQRNRECLFTKCSDDMKS